MFVACLSVVCPVGYTTASTSAALRAGIARLGETEYRDTNGEPIIGATVEHVPDRVRGRARLLALIEFALEQIPQVFRDALPWDRMPLLLCTREHERPGASLRGIFDELRLPAGASPSGGRTHVAGGQISVFDAILRARSLVMQSNVPCLVVAADSLVEPRALDWLQTAHRLKTSANTDGVAPGEAAGVAVVSRSPIGDAGVAVLGIGAARESATILNEEAFRAEGMTTALRGALEEAGLGMHEVDFRISDVAGESYAYEEMALAQARVMRSVRPSQPLWHPADCIGDCGAAAGMIQLGWVGQAFRRGYAPGPVAAALTASAFGARAAAILAAPDWRRP